MQLMINRKTISIVMVLTAFAAGATGLELDLRPPTVSSPQGVLFSIDQQGDETVLRQHSLDRGSSMAPRLSVGDELAVMLFDDRRLTVVLKEKTPTAGNRRAFLAKVKECENEINGVVVETDDGLQMDLRDYRAGKYYTVYSGPLGVKVTEMQAEKKPQYGKALEAPVSSVAENTAIAKSVSMPASGNVYVDVMINYDTMAAEWANANGGGVANFAEVQVQKMNTAIANTGLDSHFRFRLVGVYEVAGSANGSVNYALQAAQTGTVRLNGVLWDGVKAKREELSADIVCTLVDNYSSSGTTGVGYSYTPTSEDFADSAYNACLIRAVNNGHTMTHEVGHNMGAGHCDESLIDTSSCDPGPQYYEYSSGYYFTAKGTKYHTIMAYNYDGKGNFYEECPYFSSPDYQYEGVNVGDAKHDNSRTLLNNFLAVSKFRIAPYESAEIGVGVDNEEYVWTTSGTYPWTRVVNLSSDGVDSVRSCEMPSTTTSWMETMVNGPAVLSFDYKLRTCGGTFVVTCDEDSLCSRDSVVEYGDSWENIDGLEIPSGKHKIRFSYTHPGHGFIGGDGNGVWVDRVVFAGGSPGLPDGAYGIRFASGTAADEKYLLQVEHDKVVKLPECSFINPDKHFAGWQCSNGRRYDDGILVFDLTDVGEIVTMTAIWE